MALETKNHLATSFYNVGNVQAFFSGIQQAINQLPIGGVFTGDNLFTFHKNLSFLHDKAFMDAFNAHATTSTEKGTIWRIYTLCWAAKRALSIPGDFVECACYKGTTARIVADYVKLKETGKHYYLYDLFEVPVEDAKHHAMPEHSVELFAAVKKRFSDQPTVHVTQGKVPDVLHEIAPETVAMMHIDLNNADAEIGALELLFDRLSPGGILILDDYGWIYYQQQKIAEDAFFAKRGYDVLELPTGQGMVVK